MEAKIVKVKKRICAKHSAKSNGGRIYYDTAGDGCRVYMEVEADSREEAIEYCEDLTVMNNSPYDGTGRLFTAWIAFAKKSNGRYLICHSLRLDV